jgi:tetratricopeptide (TPR) repeat protein
MMTKSNALSLARVLAAVAALVAASPLGSQEPGEPDAFAGASAASASGDGLGTDAEERAAYQLVLDGQLINAREAAARILKRSPEAYAGHYVLGYVLHRAEGNLPQALYHLKLARHAFEARHGATPADDLPWIWHASTLEELASVAGGMGLHEERLQYLEARDAAYNPKWPAERGWPLMRLRRYVEARQAVEAGLASEQEHQVAAARTTLCAIESELLRREAAYRACLEAAAHDRETGQAGPHTFTNAAGSAMGLLRFDEAETLILEGTNHYVEGATSNPWLHLMWLYLAEGRTAEALGAAREMFDWQASQPPYMFEQSRAETELASAMFLLVAGRAAEAAALMERTLRRPDRTGFTSAESEQMEAASALMCSVASRTAAERKLEEASWSGWRRWLGARLEARRYRTRAWSASRRAASLVGSDRMLLTTIRPYLAGSIAVPEWMEGELCRVLGPGVVTAALEQARRHEDLPGAEAYFDAFEAEAALLQGRARAALERAARALASLPGSEVLLQARVAAVAAQAALEAGETARAVQYFDRALQLDPGVIRRLGLALPCSITAAGGAVAAEAARLLAGSPRFDAVGRGFDIRIDGDAAAGSACLLGPQREVIVCASVTPRAGEGPADAARRLVAELHEQAFAPRVDLTQADLRSLDGSTTTGGARSARQMRSILDQLSAGQDAEWAPGQ